MVPNWKELVRAAYVFIPIGIFCSSFFYSLNGGSWAPTWISGAAMIILWIMGGLFVYIVVRASYYLWFLFYRVWVVFIGAAGVSFMAYRIYDYFGRRYVEPIPGDTFLVSRGSDILIYAGATVVFGVILIWGIRLLRLLSFQRELQSSEAILSVEYIGPVDSNEKFRDRGNHIFRLGFSVKPFVHALPVFFVALERMVDETTRTGDAWTSQVLRPVRPLGLSVDDTGDTRLHPKGRLRRCVMQQGDALYALVYAKPEEEEWFTPTTPFRAVAYVSGGGFVSGVTETPSTASSAATGAV